MREIYFISLISVVQWYLLYIIRYIKHEKRNIYIRQSMEKIVIKYNKFNV